MITVGFASPPFVEIVREYSDDRTGRWYVEYTVVGYTSTFRVSDPSSDMARLQAVAQGFVLAFSPEPLVQDLRGSSVPNREDVH